MSKVARIVGGKPRRLTARQAEVVQWAAYGLTAKGTAELTGLSVKTVETHTANARVAMGVGNMAHLVAECIRTGEIH